MITSPEEYSSKMHQRIWERKSFHLRGFGGRAGRRSMITDLGGTGKAGKRRMTKQNPEQIFN